MAPEDWPQVEAIYAAGIEAGHATFEASTPTWKDFDGSRRDEHRLVAVHRDRRVLGWAACASVSSRAVYAGVVEHSVYVSPAAQGRGIGRQLLEAFVESTEQAGIWTIQSSIFPENEASLRLHARHGFRVVGTRERVARAIVGPAAGAWRDTVLVERRSGVVGLAGPA
ncbi:phosphinothricin acetyltransferase [Aeromicrobium sp. Root495]|nr:phosphinothricin acetyltransferase [Aeromicrobium sp. Root495]